ncbi:hypothetical protein [Kitasatospora sp. HPMI-4]|uniref:hypothetical protein n=1 Tax=Kitasatospora sp. HPMI-4 TaxID=3448443 RepID=UPI003F1E08F2
MAEAHARFDLAVTTQAVRIADLVAAEKAGEPVTVYATYASLERIVQGCCLPDQAGAGGRAGVRSGRSVVGGPGVPCEALPGEGPEGVTCWWVGESRGPGRLSRVRSAVVPARLVLVSLSPPLAVPSWRWFRALL